MKIQMKKSPATALKPPARQIKKAITAITPDKRQYLTAFIFQAETNPFPKEIKKSAT